jgi:cleavage stimulation factor subunit 3
LAQITKLEKRMADLYPDDPQLLRFSQRFSTPTFDPTTVLPVISPKTQMKPKLFNAVVPTVEEPPPPPQPPMPEARPSPSLMNSPRAPPALLHVSNSPKRPFEEADAEAAQPRKLLRGESPLKGAAGRRLDAARRNLARGSESVSGMNISSVPPPQPLPREINFLLNIIPGAHHYRETRFNPERMVALLREVELSQPNGNAQRQPPPPMATPVAPPPMGVWPPPPPPHMGESLNFA